MTSAVEPFNTNLSGACDSCGDKLLVDSADTRLVDISDNTASNIEEFSKGHKDFGMTFMQLDPGVFKGDTSFIDLHDVFIAKRKSNLRYFAFGKHPGYICFSFPSSPQEEYFRKKGLYNSEINLIVSNHETEYCSIVPSGFENIVIGIKISELHKYLSEAEIHRFVKSTGSDKLITIHGRLNAMTADFANQSYDELHGIDKCCMEHGVFVGQRCRLIVLFLYQFICNFHRATKSEKKSTSYERILGRGLHYIYCKAGAAITLDEMSAEIFASKRSIQYAFSELIGMSPVEFSKLLRLNVIRGDLIHINEQEMTVRHVLLNYHIKNSGRFRQEYFDLFREYPKDTLIRGLS